MLPPIQRAVAVGGAAELQDPSKLCIRCRGLTTQSEELDEYGTPVTYQDFRKLPELAWVTSAITQLAERLRSGMSSEPSINRVG